MLLGERLVRILIGFFVHTLIVRVLGPEQYGVYGYAFTFFVIFQPFVNYGGEDIYLKDIINKKDPGEVIGSGLLYKFCCALFSYITLACVIHFVQDNIETRILVLVFGLFSFFNSLTIFEIYFQSKMNFKVITLSRFVAYFVCTILKILTVLYTDSILMLAVIYVFEIAISRVIVFMFFNEYNIYLKISKEYMIKFFQMTWPLLITVILVNLNSRIGLIYLEKIGNIENVGFYSVILNLVRFVDFVPVAILTSIIPKILETQSRDYGQYRYRLVAVYSTMFYLPIFLSFFCWVLSPFVIPILYGDKFLPVIDYLTWAVLSSTVAYTNLLRTKHFLIEEKTMLWLRYNLLSVLIIFVLQFLLTSKFGITGAIASFVFGYFFAEVIFLMFSKEFRRLNFSLQAIIFPFKFFLKKIN